jgi:hypothetical protein
VAAVPLGPFVRFVLFTSTAIYQNWDTISGLFDRHVENASSPIYGYYVQHIWQQKDATGAFTDKERAMCGVHWMNTTGGDLDVTWTSADYALVESGFQALWTAQTSKIPNDFKLIEHRWYPFGPLVTPPNPPVRVTTIASPLTGTGTTTNAHAVAETLTFRTPLRRHWGRIYLPLSNPTNYSAGGQYIQSDVDNIAASGSTYLKSGNANGLVPVIWDRNRKVALGITAVEADSVPDIIRRRRPRTPKAKTVLTS